MKYFNNGNDTKLNYINHVHSLITTIPCTVIYLYMYINLITFNFSRFFRAKKLLQRACKLTIVPEIFSSRAISNLVRAPARKNTYNTSI